MSIIKYYFIVIVIIATGFTIWEKCGKKKKSGAQTPEKTEIPQELKAKDDNGNGSL